MASKTVLVFILPVLFSIVFGYAVMADILQKPDRVLNLWPSSGTQSHDSLAIIGLSEQYSVSEPIKVQFAISDPSFDCTDLYVTIYSQDVPVVQNGFFEQCFGADGIIPVDDVFSEIVNVPGSYELVAQVGSEDLGFILTSGVFTVK